MSWGLITEHCSGYQGFPWLPNTWLLRTTFGCYESSTWLLRGAIAATTALVILILLILLHDALDPLNVRLHARVDADVRAREDGARARDAVQEPAPVLVLARHWAAAVALGNGRESIGVIRGGYWIVYFLCISLNRPLQRLYVLFWV